LSPFERAAIMPCNWKETSDGYERDLPLV
jgi:hypothetical protein